MTRFQINPLFGLTTAIAAFLTSCVICRYDDYDAPAKKDRKSAIEADDDSDGDDNAASGEDDGDDE